MSWRAKVLTLYPEMFPGPLGASLAGKALSGGIWSLETVPIREFGLGRHKAVDDTPAGGGPGMVLRADVMAAALDAARAGAEEGLPVWAMTPRGQPLKQEMVEELAAGPGVILVCGRFEGIDQRFFERRAVREVSIGDYVLSGGEAAAFIVLDAAVRLLPGVMGADASLAEESFSDGLLEYPHYTRPQDFEGVGIPPVLLSGNHAEIEKWRKTEAEKLTCERRPDLWAARGDGKAKD